jgi:hypothetical protein
VTLPRPNTKSLEPWAIELLRQEHAGDDLHLQQELAQLVALLRTLPDPERSPDLAHRILQHVAEYEARPRVVHLAFGAARHLARPGVAAMLAAGIAALVAFGLSPDSIQSLFRTEAGRRTGAIGPSATRRRPAVLVRPQFVSAVPAQAPAVGPRFRLDRAPLDEAFDSSLDGQLNELMIDPTAFAERLEFVAPRDEFIARLAERAAERGDAPEIALRVRESSHPLASQIVDRLLRATLVASASHR